MMRQRARTVTPMAPPPPPSSPTVRRGLYAYVDHRVVELLTEQQLVDHAVSVLPQLQSITSRPHFHGRHWTTLRKKHGVDLFQFDPAGSSGGAPIIAPRPAAPASTSSTRSTASSTGAFFPPPPLPSLSHGFQTQLKLPNPGMDMAYAIVAQCELDCHMNDAMDVLFSAEPIEFESSMKALWNHKLKRGDLLLTRSVEGPESEGTLAIKTATVGNGLSLKWKQHDFEKLCYTSYTQRNPTTNQAFHVVKTLPLEIHDQIVCGKTHAALRDRSVDHIAVGYHLTGYDSLLGGGPRTRVVICAYAAPVVTSPLRASDLHWHPRMGVGMAPPRRNDLVHADVRRIVQILAKAARHFPQAVRQRRFGSQRFVYFPTDRSSCFVLEQCCVVCLRRFGLFRKDHYCQLCGHLVCRQCSRKDKVETTDGKLRENRMCFPCVARVDTGAFHEEKLWKNMNRPIVVDADVISPVGFPAILEVTGTDDDDDDEEGTYSVGELDRSYCSVASSEAPPSVTRPELQVAHDLFSPNPRRRASALEALSLAVVTRNTTGYGSVPATPTKQAPVDLDKRVMKKQTKKEPVAKTNRRESLGAVPLIHHHSHPTKHDFPLRPSMGRVPATPRRVVETDVISDTHAFDSICEVAMQRLDCSVAFIVVFESRGRSRILGLHHSADIGHALPPDHEIVRTYPDQLMGLRGPVFVNEPTRDARFRECDLVHYLGARFFAQFPIASPPQSKMTPLLCVIGSYRREALASKEEAASLRAVCSLAADLIAA